MRFLSFLLVFFLLGCSDDPYDPAIGPRNPRPGAERYLSTRNDIPQSEKNPLLNYTPCSLDVLKELSNAPSREVRSLVAANPSADIGIFEKLINDKEPGVRGYVASNPKTPRSILLKLRNDPDETVRWTLPGNPNWTGDDIRQMYREKVTSPSVIAANPSTPEDLLEELSRLSDYNVKSALANNPNIPDGIVRKLAQEGNPSVKIMLTYNRATSAGILKTLAGDSNPDVRRYARLYLKRRFPRIADELDE